MGLFLDLLEAYDMVDHDILLDKLYPYGLRGESDLWFKSYKAYFSNQLQLEDVCSVCAIRLSFGPTFIFTI
jgi:hypothetical protein